VKEGLPKIWVMTEFALYSRHFTASSNYNVHAYVHAFQVEKLTGHSVTL